MILLKGVIFDMDGVIVDSEPIHVEIEKELLERFGGKMNDEEHASFIGTTDAHMWSILKEKYNLKPSVKEIINMKREMFLNSIDKIELIDGVLDFIKGLHERGYKLGLASSNNRKSVMAIVEKFHLDKYIDVIMSGEDVNNGKPNPEIFLKTAKMMNLKPASCIVIEDAENGVRAAKAAKMKCIVIKGHNIGHQDVSSANLIIESFKEITLDQVEALYI